MAFAKLSSAGFLVALNESISFVSASVDKPIFIKAVEVSHSLRQLNKNIWQVFILKVPRNLTFFWSILRYLVNII